MLNTNDLVISVAASHAATNLESISVYTTNDAGNIVPVERCEVVMMRDEDDVPILVMRRGDE